ncbi:MAG TPA: hypothetical protein VMN99_15785 [Anaerolineales bacterium]|nr:hypothetical protein [Anaerolineales bacterium]
MKTRVVASLLLPVLAFAACSDFVQPIATATPTFTLTSTRIPAITPTNTPLPPTETPAAVSTLVPEGQPASEWNGIPIMPGAIAGEGDEEGYVFTVKATPQQIQEYYELELGKLGWQPFATGGGDLSLMLIFMNNASETLTVNVITKGAEALVLLVK